MPVSNVTKFPGGHWAQQFHFESHGVLVVVVITIAFLMKSYTSQIYTVWSFFTRRRDFIKSEFEKIGRLNTFSFNILHVRLLLSYTCHRAPPFIHIYV